MRKFVTIGVFISACFMAEAQTMVTSVKNKEQQKEEAVAYYFLPKNSVEVNVYAKKTVRKAGPFAAEMKRLFGVAPEIASDGEAWTIENVCVKRLSEPDPAHQYKVYAPFSSNACLVNLASNGVIDGVNAGCATSSIPEKSSKCRKKKHEKSCKNAVNVKDCKFVTYYKFAEEESEPSESDSVVVKKKEKKSDAELVYDKINNLRKIRQEILLMEGDVLQDNGVSAYLKEIDKTEKELFALFNGKTYTETVSKKYSFYPEKEGDISLFKFSKSSGFDEGDAVTVSMKKKSGGIKQDVSNSKTGFVYRMPAVVHFDVKSGKDFLYSCDIEIAQQGSVMSLPVSMFDKNDIKADFDVETGALLNIYK